MKTLKKMSIIIAMLTLWIAYVHADDNTSTETRRRNHEPPPEAYAACEDKNAGDAAQLVGPRGETITGTCELEGDRLFCGRIIVRVVPAGTVTGLLRKRIRSVKTKTAAIPRNASAREARQ